MIPPDPLFKNADHGQGIQYVIHNAPKEKIKEIASFLANVFEAIDEGKSPWGKLFDRLGGYFDRKFHGTQWHDREAEYWENKLKEDLFF